MKYFDFINGSFTLFFFIFGAFREVYFSDVASEAYLKWAKKRKLLLLRRCALKGIDDERS